MNTSQALDGFMDPGGVNLESEVDAVAANAESLTLDQVSLLFQALQPHMDDSVVYGAEFDLSSEVQAQIKMVRAMRRSVITDAGIALPGISARELKEVVSASTTLLTTLTKSHDKIMGYERMRALEAATVAAVEGLSEASQRAFFTTLEEKLEGIA